MYMLLTIIHRVHFAVAMPSKGSLGPSTTEFRLTTFSPHAHYDLIGFFMMAMLM